MEAQNKLDQVQKTSKPMYTYDIEYDYFYGGTQTNFEKIIEDRNWFRLDRKPFELKRPQSLPHFLYRFELTPPFDFANLRTAIENGSRLTAISKLPHSEQVGDKSHLFRNIVNLQRSRGQPLFEFIPVTFSFDSLERNFHRDLQRFCRIFLAVQRHTTPDQIPPLRTETDPATGRQTPIYFEFRHARFPPVSSTSLVDSDFENPTWDELAFNDSFFGADTNKWMLKAGEGYRGAGNEMFSTLDELDQFVALFLTGYPYCYYDHIAYSPSDEGSPSLMPGAKSAEKTRRVPIGRFVVQKYMEKPQLLKGYKYNLRLYSMFSQEIKAYMCQEWNSNLCGTPFDLHSKNYISHMSNYDLAKKSPEYESLGQYNILSRSETLLHVSIREDLHSKMIKMIFDSVIVNGKNLLNPIDFPNVFEIYGIDIFYDVNGRPWLLECNQEPDLLGENNEYLDKCYDRLLDDYFKLTIDKIFTLPADARRLGKDFTFLDYPLDTNIWSLVEDYSTAVIKNCK